jgi:hypothetical protein
MGRDIMGIGYGGQKIKDYIINADYASKDYTDKQINTGVTIPEDTMISFGDFSITSEDLGRLLRKLAKKEMPELLI